MKVKVSELQGAALDWAVAKCEGEPIRIENGQVLPGWSQMMPTSAAYSTDWALAGPVIERERISVEVLKEGDGWCATFSCTPHDFLLLDQPYASDASYGEGETALIAAMRCYVASKMGDEIEIPDELSKEQSRVR